jgi:hypothetical protein
MYQKYLFLYDGDAHGARPYNSLYLLVQMYVSSSLMSLTSM